MSTIRLALALLLAGWASHASAQIIATPHNLSASGPGKVRSLGGAEVCFFCHTPHNAQPATPGWSRNTREVSYIPYSSSTLKSGPGQPTGDSKLCLSCHDGTIGLGNVLKRRSPMEMTGRLSARMNLTTDLSDDHPVSFVYDRGLAALNGELRDPDTLPAEIKLDSEGQMQCTSCHDAHSSLYEKLLVFEPAYSELCVACHDKRGWVGSSHAMSPATWDGIGTDPWPNTEHDTVAANGCENCHDSHSAGGSERILNYHIEEENCLVCHDGGIASTDIRGELLKTSRHAVNSYLGDHDPVEDFDLMPRHVECVDCHNPHAVTDADGSVPGVSGPLLEVAGVTISGLRTEGSAFEYEVCFRCHGDNPGFPGPTLERQLFEANIRVKFDTGNPSFHPLAGPGQNPSVPSLIHPWTESSLMYCTDCHNNDEGPDVGGTGPNGPHGSSWPFLLSREYSTQDDTVESAQSYALCYECHSRDSLLADESFTQHQAHVVLERTPCSVCHDPHGVRAQGSGDHTHLINFRTDLVSPDPETGRLEFIDLGEGRGECYLECHARRHSPEAY